MTAPARLALSRAPNAAQALLLNSSSRTAPLPSCCRCPSAAVALYEPVRQLSVGSATAGGRTTATRARALSAEGSITLSVRWAHASASTSAPASSSSSSSSSSSGGGGQLDVFHLFGLKVEDIPGNGWGIDDKEVKNKWRRLMANTHPDRMAGKSEEEQQAAAQHSTVVNRAYETLINPLLRAQYLLERHGISPADEADSLEDSELLMEVLELRERLEDASSEQHAVEVREENRERLNETLAHLSKAFGASPPDLEQARKLTVELRYWLNIDKAAREWAPGKRVELQH